MADDTASGIEEPVVGSMQSDSSWVDRGMDDESIRVFFLQRMPLECIVLSSELEEARCKESGP